MAVFNESDFITTPSGVKLSSNFILFNSKMLSEVYNEEAVVVAVVMSNILSNFAIEEKILEYVQRLESIDIGEDGYLRINKNKNKMKFGKLIHKINALDREHSGLLFKSTINIQNVESIVDFYKSWVIINESKKLRFVEYVGDAIKIGYNMSNYFSKDHGNMLSNSCMNGCYHLLKLYIQNPDKVSLLALVDGDDKIHGRAFLWQLDNGETYLDRIYTIDNFITVIFQDHAMKNEWVIRKSNDLSYNAVSICKLDKATKKYTLLDENASKMKIKLNTKDVDYYPYMDTFFVTSRWGRTFRSYSRKIMWYYKYHSTMGYRKKRVSLFGLKF